VGGDRAAAGDHGAPARAAGAGAGHDCGGRAGAGHGGGAPLSVGAVVRCGPEPSVRGRSPPTTQTHRRVRPVISCASAIFSVSLEMEACLD
jgi:hypothetical protein